jgi:NAD(P)-dependent dehydrogenase (short-subunit alcohol dehydrogenase family)
LFECKGKPMFRLKDKVALITGGAQGIGRATARCFVHEGARVVLLDMAADAGEALAKELGDAAIFLRTDVSNEAQMRDNIESGVKHFGRLDILHNNAGGSQPGDSNVIDVAIEEFWKVIHVDLFGTFLGCRFGLPHLIRAGGGSVINMSSNMALMGVKGRDCYTSAKGAISALTRSMAVEFAEHKVRVNAIAPSATLTERVQKLIANNPAVSKLSDAHLLGAITPEDIAQAVLFLASDDSRRMTGQILPVDSGVTIS